MLFETDFPRSYKSKKSNDSKIGNVYDRFLEYGEELARNLEQPASCRAYASCFDEQELWRKWPPERGDIGKRSLKRHLHSYSHLENREIGQIQNLQGKRSLEAAILASECREFRFDQTLFTKSRRGAARKLRWAENRRIIMRDVQKIVAYDAPKQVLDLAPEFGGDPVEQIMIVEPDDRDYGTLFECHKYILVLRKSSLDVFCFENTTKKPTKLLKTYILPRGWKYQKIGWNKINESIFVQANKRNCEKKRKEHSFLMFQAFPFEFETSFSIDSHAIPDWCSPIQNITIEEDLVQIITKSQAIFYSFPEICQKFGNSAGFSEARERIGLKIEIPVMFEISKLGEPLRYLMGSFLMIQCSSNMPLLVGFPTEKTREFCIKNYENPEIPPIFPANFPVFRGGRDSMELGMFSRLQHESCLIFPDFFTATFLVYEGCDAVKYCVGNHWNLAENASNPLKISEVWRTRIFPHVSDRNEYRKLEYDQRYCRGEIPAKKRRVQLRTPPFIEAKLWDYVPIFPQKIHDTQFDDENLHINLSIDVAHVTPDGYFESTDYGNPITVQFQYIIDYENGEILRIIPIFGQNFGAEQISIEEDLMIIQKTHQNLPKIEIWELIEPQQYLSDAEAESGAEKNRAKKFISRAEKRKSLFWQSADFHLPDEDDDSDYRFMRSVMKGRKTAAIVVIGDEILKGTTKDTNSHFLSQRLHELGVNLKKICVVGDEIEEISREIRNASKHYDYVITSGGVGPTHDDKTYLGLARAFDDQMHFSIDIREAVNRFLPGYTAKKRAEILQANPIKPPKLDVTISEMTRIATDKLSTVPKSSELLWGTQKSSGEPSIFPVVKLKNVISLPGVPRFCEKAFDELQDQLFPVQERPKVFKETIYTNLDEFDFSIKLTELAQRFSGKCEIGSYPEGKNGKFYKTKLIIEAEMPEILEKCAKELRELLQGHLVYYDSQPWQNTVEKWRDFKLRSTPMYREKLEVAERIVQKIVDEYSLDEIALSFNGGKDCTVLLHLLRVMVDEKYGPGKVIQGFHIVVEDQFPEATQFIIDAAKFYNITVLEFPGPLKSGLEALKKQRPRITPVLMGSRSTDPTGKYLKSPIQWTDSDWPKVLRVCPILDWTYTEVWMLLRGLCIPYCKLYDQGYTSLGGRDNTVKNEALKIGNDVYLPAYRLIDDEEERKNRSNL
ncbi:unnamed protein product [Caenorhabditis angaria]|uniref:FAD synthase n=1 Tax=Caenorhabditis angaria TaxID=860376 RepID=A0A9P1I9J5_9PELO|nr:unnamed protein product [Caenorhabditis angaria]